MKFKLEVCTGFYTNGSLNSIRSKKKKKKESMKKKECGQMKSLWGLKPALLLLPVMNVH